MGVGSQLWDVTAAGTKWVSGMQMLKATVVVELPQRESLNLSEPELTYQPLAYIQRWTGHWEDHTILHVLLCMWAVVYYVLLDKINRTHQTNYTERKRVSQDVWEPPPAPVTAVTGLGMDWSFWM